MKKWIVSLLLIVSLGAAAQSPSLAAAEKTAAAGNKWILLRFSGSDWCLPCIRMEKDVFSQPAFSQYAADKLVLLQADFPRLKKHQLSKEVKKDNEELAATYNPKGLFPYTVLLTAEGKTVKTWEGAAAATPQQFVQQLEAVIHAR